MLNTPANWNAAMANGVPWQDAYAAVEEAVKTLFLDPAVTGRVTTSRLVEFLYPEQWAKGEGITARKRIFGALKALAKHQLKDYCEPGEPRPLKHNKTKMVTPLIWRAPQEQEHPYAALIAELEVVVSDPMWDAHVELNKATLYRWIEVLNG